MPAPGPPPHPPLSLDRPPCRQPRRHSYLSDLISYHHMLTPHYTPASLPSLLVLENAEVTPPSGPLHLLFALPGSLFLQKACLDLSARLAPTLPAQSLSRLPSLKKLLHCSLFFSWLYFSSQAYHYLALHYLSIDL